MHEVFTLRWDGQQGSPIFGPLPPDEAVSVCDVCGYEKLGAWVIEHNEDESHTATPIAVARKSRAS